MTALTNSMLFSGCATIVNVPNIPVTATFSDSNEGQCKFNHNHGVWNTDICGTDVIRRSDDPLIYACNTDDAGKSDGPIVSEFESRKFAASGLPLRVWL